MKHARVRYQATPDIGRPRCGCYFGVLLAVASAFVVVVGLLWAFLLLWPA